MTPNWSPDKGETVTASCCGFRMGAEHLYGDERDTCPLCDADWQPIETALRDTKILIGRTSGWLKGTSIGWYHSDYNGHKDVISDDGRCGPVRAKKDRPTLWLPLPSPPLLHRETNR